jgi:hypothetical protein
MLKHFHSDGVGNIWDFIPWGASGNDSQKEQHMKHEH